MSESAVYEEILSALAGGVYPAAAVLRVLAAPPVAFVLAERLLGEPSPAARAVGLDLLRQSKTAGSRQERLILRGLEDGSEQVRAAAALAAAKVGSASAHLDRALLSALQLSQAKPWPVLLALGLRAQDKGAARAALSSWLLLAPDLQDGLYACQALLRLGGTAETTAAAIRCSLRSDRVDDVGFALDLCEEFGELLQVHCPDVELLQRSADPLTAKRAREALTSMRCVQL